MIGSWLQLRVLVCVIFSIREGLLKLTRHFVDSKASSFLLIVAYELAFLR